MSGIKSAFSAEPLITPKRLATEPAESIFSVVPPWADSMSFVTDDGGQAHGLVFVVGGVPINASALPAAVLAETTRAPDISIKMDANAGSRRNSQPYHRYSFARAPADLVQVVRVINGLGAGQVAKAAGSPRSVDPGAHLVVPGHATREARALLFKHICLSVGEALAAGEIGGDAALGYFANLAALFDALDGREG